MYIRCLVTGLERTIPIPAIVVEAKARNRAGSANLLLR